MDIISVVGVGFGAIGSAKNIPSKWLRDRGANSQPYTWILNGILVIPIQCIKH